MYNYNGAVDVMLYFYNLSLFNKEYWNNTIKNVAVSIKANNPDFSKRVFEKKLSEATRELEEIKEDHILGDVQLNLFDDAKEVYDQTY